MTLSQEDGELYYKLWLPLLDYVNKKYRVNRKLKSIDSKGTGSGRSEKGGE